MKRPRKTSKQRFETSLDVLRTTKAMLDRRAIWLFGKPFDSCPEALQYVVVTLLNLQMPIGCHIEITPSALPSTDQPPKLQPKQ
jgi:hypothetical protein